MRNGANPLPRPIVNAQHTHLALRAFKWVRTTYYLKKIAHCKLAGAVLSLLACLPPFSPSLPPASNESRCHAFSVAERRPRACPPLFEVQQVLHLADGRDPSPNLRLVEWMCLVTDTFLTSKALHNCGGTYVKYQRLLNKRQKRNLDPST